MPSGIPEGARCVQRFDDSLNSAIHITYRISLRSSSMGEPRDPLLKVVLMHRWMNRNRRRMCTYPKASNNPPPKNSIMILPQVHLRKPCYDFYFL
ncbi:hypothetical protein F5879DRAFT_813457 [Lentinula edodes]|nr:hypothetical protein GG344DRAFT_60791 [Lentinula edodes]KAJ3897821.1 hypothetical protein F5879DRAFT_813457 [Lentinula edodes]KAJ3911563.1 hypothetical protein F5877DRAFT_55181 [Lentinula edodes]